jgi:hypothetical protein
VAKRVLDKLRAGEPLDRYGYGSAPLREEVIERFHDAQGELAAAVTRNAYGAMVLNAAWLMFIDLDFAPSSLGEELKYFFVRLFNKTVLSPDARREAEMRERLEQFLREHRQWGIRIYRTFAGLRAVVTHDLFDPASETTSAVFRQLGADPLYVRLCTAQQCFRARLTPKPWRCGHVVNSIHWPRETEDQQEHFRQWLLDYKSCQSSYATCRYLGTLGSESIHPEIETLLKVHDTVTRATESLALA